MDYMQQRNAEFRQGLEAEFDRRAAERASDPLAAQRRRDLEAAFAAARATSRQRMGHPAPARQLPVVEPDAEYGAPDEPSAADRAEMQLNFCISELTEWAKSKRAYREQIKEQLNVAFQSARMGLKVIRWEAWA